MAAQQDAKSSQRQRPRSMLSFGSHKSNGSFGKMDLTETAREKSSRRITTNADPSKALNEAQPSAQALEKPTLQSLRSIQHRDSEGNIIADPDLSNPTRPRMERPLDTIRSFEAAIDVSYNRRYSHRPGSVTSTYGQSPRSSYHQGYGNGGQTRTPRAPVEVGTYLGRMPGSRPESYIDNHQPGMGRRSSPRTLSGPMLYGNNSNGMYSGHAHQQSYDTTTASTVGSYGTDQGTNSTDPSSENSSNDKINQTVKPDFTENYGLSTFGGAPQFQGPILEEHGVGLPAYGQPGYGQFHNSLGAGHAYQGNSMPPPPPPHQSSYPPPTKLDNPSSARAHTHTDRIVGVSPTGRSDTGEKRKSWLKRTFSKN